MPTPHVLLGHEASALLRDGIDLLARLVSLSLGPRTGALAFERDDRRKSAELLTSSATIARRMLAIPGRGATAGAMLLRHAIWRTHERLGDGGATTAALTHALSMKEWWSKDREAWIHVVVRGGMMRARIMCRDKVSVSHRGASKRVRVDVGK